MDVKEKIQKLLEDCVFPYLKIPHAAVTAILILAATCLYILFWVNPYIAIPGSNVFLKLGAFERCEISFRNKVYFDDCTVNYFVLPGESSTNYSQPFVQSLQYEGTAVTITNALFSEHAAGKKSIPNLCGINTH